MEMAKKMTAKNVKKANLFATLTLVNASMAVLFMMECALGAATEGVTLGNCVTAKVGAIKSAMAALVNILNSVALAFRNRNSLSLSYAVLSHLSLLLLLQLQYAFYSKHLNYFYAIY